MNLRKLVNQEEAKHVSEVVQTTLREKAGDLDCLTIIVGLSHVLSYVAVVSGAEEDDLLGLCRQGFRAAKRGLELMSESQGDESESKSPE